MRSLLRASGASDHLRAHVVLDRNFWGQATYRSILRDYRAGDFASSSATLSKATEPCLQDPCGAGTAMSLLDAFDEMGGPRIEGHVVWDRVARDCLPRLARKAISGGCRCRRERVSCLALSWARNVPCDSFGDVFARMMVEFAPAW